MVRFYYDVIFDIHMYVFILANGLNKENLNLLLNVENFYVISRQIVERRVTKLRNITSDFYLNIVVSLDCY